MKKTIIKLVTRILKVKIPLPISIQYNRIEDIKIAVNLKVDVNFHELYNDAYVYPLMTAIYFGRYDICNLLLNKGCADPNFIFRQKGKSDLLNVFSDPLLRVSNQKNPPRLQIDLTGWKRITPTVLAFILGNYDLLDLCLKKGGRLVDNFDHDSVPFVWYFLEHPSTCQSNLCRLLVNYREFIISRSEQESFQEFCEKFRVMKAKIIMSVDLTEDIEKIILMLTNYGFRKRESKKPMLSPNQKISSMPVYSEYVTEEEEEMELKVYHSHSEESSSSSCCSSYGSDRGSCNEGSGHEEHHTEEGGDGDEQKVIRLGTRRRSISTPVHLDITILSNDDGSDEKKEEDSSSCYTSDTSSYEKPTLNIPRNKRREFRLHSNKAKRSITLDPSQSLQMGMGRPPSSISDSEENDFFISRTKEMWIHHHNYSTSATSGNEYDLKDPHSDLLSSSSSEIDSENQRRILLRQSEQACLDHRRVSESYKNLKTVLKGSMTPFRFRRPKSSFRRGKKDLLKADDSLVRNSINYRKKRRENNRIQQQRKNHQRRVLLVPDEGDRY